ncbi:hypothetical protein J1N35_005354, partial [Gossypium stocksii]
SMSDNSKLTSEWILDLGCSFHMCPNREWFSTYSSVEGRVVRIGNDSFSKVIGIGTIKIKCTSRRLEVFQPLSTDSTQLIPCIVQDRLVASFGKDGIVEI